MDRVKYGEESKPWGIPVCPDCGVKTGEYHDQGATSRNARYAMDN
jgi:hypothetical protein